MAHASSLLRPAGCRMPGASSQCWVLLGPSGVRVRSNQAPLSDLSFLPGVSERPFWFPELAGQTGSQGRSSSFLSLMESLPTRGCEGQESQLTLAGTPPGWSQLAPASPTQGLLQDWEGLAITVLRQKESSIQTGRGVGGGWEGILKDTENQ